MKKHSFEFPADQLGRPGAVKAYRGNKNDYVTPVADLSGMAELLTNTPLEAIEVYSQFGQDRLGAVLIDRAQGGLIRTAAELFLSKRARITIRGQLHILSQ